MRQKWESYPSSIRLLAVAAIIFSTGMACIWPLVTIYIHDYLGKPLPVAGFLLLLNQGAFLIGSITGGMLFDRWGRMRTIIIGSVGIILITIGLGLTHDFTVYTILLLLNGLFYGTLSPVMNALAVVLWPEGGRKGINMIYVALNAGVAAGSALGGLLASVSFSWTFFGNALTQMIVLAIFVIFLPRHLKAAENRPLPASPAGESDTSKTDADEQLGAHGAGELQPTRKVVWGALLFLCSGLLISWIVYVQWTTVLSTYMQSLGISLRQYSLLWTLNGGLILFGQPLIAWVIRRFARTLKAQMLLGSYVFALSMLILSQSTSYAGFVAAMFIMTLGEMLVWPAVPAVAAQITPAGREGFIQGLIAGTGSAGRMLGPLLGAIIFQHFQAQGLLYIMAGLALLSVAFFAFHTTFLNRRQKVAVPTAEKM
ncbi:MULTISPECIES: MDR family MFS transporter [Brevibacillus]|uniref:Putative MFS-type transporter YttB n=1 Tax=Brevibacillus parabrevis TaxID=54914 RepID=A0A4Y3PEG5_BREPA|nr:MULTISPECIES: MFS transporter [Brevibacillus]RNB95716.1 MFS transporter [Brevibacillus parabrevis]GEB32930.1 putative MFS-type transporter YttB [Brevibacillus parabrevis]HBZ82088.1 MFS transporter [Brevibacillus sp.]